MTPRRCTQAPTGPAALAAAQHRASVPVLETERLRLRAPEMGDLRYWTEIFTGEASKGLGGPYSAEEAWTEFSYYTACWMLHGHGLWTVERQSDGVVVGFVHLGLEWGDEEPELGWLFLPEHHGQGYATEAVIAAREFGLSLLPTFVSYIDPANLPSNQLAARIGAKRDTDEETRIAKIEGELTHVWRHRGSA